MTKIYNRATLDQEIDRLKNLAAAKENNLQTAFQELSNNLTPANLISSGFKSIFNRSPLSKPLISTGIGLLSGLFIEKVILKNENILLPCIMFKLSSSVKGLVPVWCCFFFLSKRFIAS